MSITQLFALFVVAFAIAVLIAFACELRRRARHLREHPDWRPGDPL